MISYQIGWRHEYKIAHTQIIHLIKMNEIRQPTPDQKSDGIVAPALRKLDRFIILSKLIIAIETLWPKFISLSSIIGIFLIYSLSNAANYLNPLGRLFILCTCSVSIIIFIYRVISTQFPNLKKITRRIDQDTALPHRIIQSVLDKQAKYQPIKNTTLLWNNYIANRWAALKNLNLPKGKSELPYRDPLAIRFQIWIIVFAVGFVFYGELKSNFIKAFKFDQPVFQIVPYPIEGWISPPSYTGIPPILLSLNPSSKFNNIKYSVPINSILTIKTNGENLTIERDGIGTFTQESSNELTNNIYQASLSASSRFLIQDHKHAAINIDIDVIPDRIPTIEFIDSQYFDSEKILVSYEILDDYTVQHGDLRIIARAHDKSISSNARKSLVPEPVFDLPLPANKSEHRAQLAIDTSMVPSAWMGLIVSAVLVVKDYAGQEGYSKEFFLTLPQRPLKNSLARAISNQSQTLLQEPDERYDILKNLRTIISNPNIFQIELGQYLNLRSVTKSVQDATSERELLEAGINLDQLALVFDDDQKHFAKDELNTVFKALRRELERNDNSATLHQLIDQLKHSLQQYLGELSSRPSPGGNTRTKEPAGKGDQKSLNDLLSMIEKFEQYQQSGNSVEANQILNDLQAILDRLQPENADGGGAESEKFSSLLDDLDHMERKQQELRDENFQRLNGKNTGQRDLADQQQRELSQGLQNLLEELQGLGVPDLKSLAQALDSMRSAERSAQSEGRAGLIDDQNRAIKELREGKQELSNLLQGGKKGSSSGPKRNSADSNQLSPRKKSIGSQGHTGDSLGDLENYTNRNRDYTDGSRRRSEEILNELNRKLGEPDRSARERDYFQRLLELN